MDIENIIEKIFAKRKELDFADLSEDGVIWNEIHKLEKKIKDLAPRIEKLFRVAEALNDNRFWLGKLSDYNQSSPQFVTDFIDQRFGFFVINPFFKVADNDYTLTGYIGIADEKSHNDKNLMIDRYGEILPWYCLKNNTNDANYKHQRSLYLKLLTKAVNDFDMFEKSFYEYAADPIPTSKNLQKDFEKK